jgi:hypothetical protein
MSICSLTEWVFVIHALDFMLANYIKYLDLDFVNAAADYPCSDSGKQERANSDDFIFLYEDFEGDRMLLGDVPWE